MSVRSPSDPSLELDIGEICSFEFSDTEFKKILNDELTEIGAVVLNFLAD